MNNLLRTLIYNEEVSFTLIDGTKIVQEGARIHSLLGKDAGIFGKVLLFCTFLSSGLKEESGEVSVSLRGKDKIKQIVISGNHSLRIRGSIDFSSDASKQGFSESAFLFDSLTVIRDDGYGMPFVGSCEIIKGKADESFEEYFRSSEQLPTFIKTNITFGTDGIIESAKIAVAQPLPFADKKSIASFQDGKLLEEAIKSSRSTELKSAAQKLFGELKAIKEEEASYKCNCSREYISSILRTLPKEEIMDEIKKTGSIKVHCHYCNTDYSFTKQDAEKLFKR